MIERLNDFERLDRLLFYQSEIKMARGYCHQLMSMEFLFRKKKLDNNVIEETKLDRCLNAFDLTILGNN